MNEKQEVNIEINTETFLLIKKSYDQSNKKQYGKMTALRGTKIIGAPLAAATKSPRTIDKEFYQIAEVFFG